jgi:anaerobic selenocysteine-containing dehydrogenase
VELSDKDAAAVGVTEGDIVRVESRRGSLEGRVRISGVRPGVVFVPFHYGYWDLAADTGPGHGDGHARRAANEVTITAWDPVSKQPLFKVAAVRVTKVGTGGGSPSPAPTVGAPAPLDPSTVPPTVGGTPAEATATPEA